MVLADESRTRAVAYFAMALSSTHSAETHLNLGIALEDHCYLATRLWGNFQKPYPGIRGDRATATTGEERCAISAA